MAQQLLVLTVGDYLREGKPLQIEAAFVALGKRLKIEVRDAARVQPTWVGSVLYACQQPPGRGASRGPSRRPHFGKVR